MPRAGSLRWRLGLIYALVLAAALAGVLVLVNALVERALIDSTVARLEVEAGLIADSAGNAPSTTLPAPDVARILGGQQTAVVILDGSGAELATQANGASADVVDARLDAATYASVLDGNRVVDAVLFSVADGSRILVVAAPIRFTTADTSTPEPTPETRPSPTARPPGPPETPPGLGRGQGQGLGRGLGQGRGNSQGAGNGAGGTGTGGTGTANGQAPAEPPNAIAQLGVSLADVDAALANLRGTLLSIGVVALLVALAISFLVTTLGLRPLSRVAAVADRVAAGDLSARARLPSGADEIGRLGRAFDRMVDRLEGAFAAQRQFAADASHELRSPLTVLGGYVDVLARGAHEAPEAADRILGSMRREIDRLSRLAADLLFLTQLEAGGGRLAPERLDVGDLLVDLADAARVMGDDRRVAVERDGPLPVVVDRDRLTQALLNLVDNAVRHTPEAGLVRLSGRRDGGTIVAEVYNEGSPIPPEHLPHLFDRFYRSDRFVEPGRHAGLGLAIVKAIVEASGGTVSATSDASGTRFVVRLPLAPTGASQHPLSEATAAVQDRRLP
jgi:two-component system OmpR family sensor kinase